MSPPARQRDLFPLPVCGSSSFLSALPAVSRKVQRRVQRRCHVDRGVDEAAQALNFLTNSDSVAPASSLPTAAHAAVRRELTSAVRRLGAPPEGLDPAGAFAELRGASAYHEPDTHVVPYDHSLLSLPAEGRCPVSLQALLGREGPPTVDGFVNSCMLPSNLVGDRLRSLNLRAPYVDPLLASSPRSYAKFLRRLYAASLIDSWSGKRIHCAYWCIFCSQEVR